MTTTNHPVRPAVDDRPVLMGTREEVVAMLAAHRAAGTLKSWDDPLVSRQFPGKVLVRYELREAPLAPALPAGRPLPRPWYMLVPLWKWYAVAGAVVATLGVVGVALSFLLQVITAHAAQLLGIGALAFLILSACGHRCIVIVQHIRQ